jgi:hypothetical protein
LNCCVEHIYAGGHFALHNFRLRGVASDRNRPRRDFVFSIAVNWWFICMKHYAGDLSQAPRSSKRRHRCPAV